VEQYFETYIQELLPIVETLKEWQHYLNGANHKVSIRCDHKNLKYFQTSNVLSRRQARWSETLSAYDFVIEHLAGRTQPMVRPDGPTTRSAPKGLWHDDWQQLQ
jgi:hypothetical protein